MAEEISISSSGNFTMRPFSLLAWTWIFLPATIAFPAASDLFSDDGDIFSQEGTAGSEPFPSFDSISPSGDLLGPDLFMADSSPCLSDSNLQLIGRDTITTRESGGEFCLDTAASSSTPTASPPALPQPLDLTRLNVVGRVKEYCCSEFISWGFGIIPVCSVRDRKGTPSEEELADMEILKMQQPSGFKNFLDCSLSR